MEFAIACVVVVVLILGYVSYEDLRHWNENFADAKKYLFDLGYKHGRYETALVDGETVVFSPRTDEETTKEPMTNFLLSEFGKNVKVYVHNAGNLAFMTTDGESTMTFLIYEK